MKKAADRAFALAQRYTSPVDDYFRGLLAEQLTIAFTDAMEEARADGYRAGVEAAVHAAAAVSSYDKGEDCVLIRVMAAIRAVAPAATAEKP